MKYEQHSFKTNTKPYIFKRYSIHKSMTDYTHWHESIELLYITKGSGCVNCNFKTIDVKEGDIFVINSENLHMVNSDSSIEYYYLIVDSELLSTSGLSIENLTFRQLIKDEEMTKRYKKIIETYESDVNFKDARLFLLILHLVERLLDFVVTDSTVDQTPPANLANVKMAIKYIKENSNKKLTIDEIAEASDLSKAYLSRKFKAITGFTIVNYINLVRCQNASKLIRSGKFKINEAAIECGFENMSYFTKTYKKYTGKLPSEETIQQN